jgi:phosphoribosylglycinamide formyltransferase-1
VPSERHSLGTRPRAVILASGAGSNARNVLVQVAAGILSLDVVAVISNGRSAGALEIAREYGVEDRAVLWDRASETRAAYDARLLEQVASARPDVVLLLGWMHLLPPEFLQRFPETLNVHPAYLPLDPEADVVEMPDGTTIPALRGAHAVRDAVRAGLPWSGASVHVVTDATDRGRILVRVPCTVAPGTEEASLTAQIRRLEFRAVPDAIRIWLDARARKWEEEHHGR